MPDPVKKVLVKVKKKEAKGEIIEDKNIEGRVPKGLTKDFIDKVNETTAINTKRREVEAIAKNDSISSAKVAKFNGKDIVDQRRAGNKSANETRAKGGVPQVARGRYTNGEPDKYYTGGASALRSDSYDRVAPLEKDMPIRPKVIVKVKKK